MHAHTSACVHAHTHKFSHYTKRPVNVLESILLLEEIHTQRVPSHPYLALRISSTLILPYIASFIIKWQTIKASKGIWENPCFIPSWSEIEEVQDLGLAFEVGVALWN